MFLDKSFEVQTHIESLKYEEKHNVPGQEIVYFSVFPNKHSVCHYFKKAVDAKIYLDDITKNFHKHEHFQRHRCSRFKFFFLLSVHGHQQN